MTRRTMGVFGVAVLFGVSAVSGAQAGWHLTDVALLGAEPTAPLFTGARAMAFGTSGELLVLDAQVGEVVALDIEAGTPVWTAGAKGQGPGEFQDPTLIAAAADGSFVVFDRAADNRISRFAPDGVFVGSTTVSRAHVSGTIRSLAVTSTGTFLLRVPSRVAYPGPDEVRYPQLLFLAEAGGSLRDVFDWTELGVEPVPPQDRRSALRLYIDPRPIWSVLPKGRHAVARSDRYEVAILDENGRRVGALHRSVELQRITEAMKRQFMAQLPPRLREQGIEWGEFLPLLTDVFPGPDDTVLVMRGRNGAPVVDVFSRDFDFLAEVDLPEGFQLMATHDDLLAGKVTTEDLEEAVRVLRLER